jgi:enoyl-CoA hydratase/carnithine racemase
MLTALQAALDAIAKTNRPAVVVIAANGKAFCPGHNLKEMVATPSSRITRSCSRNAAA